MNWGAYIKRTAVRRVVWIIVGLALYAVLGWFGNAWAQSTSAATRQEAYQNCMAATTVRDEQGTRAGPNVCTKPPANNRYDCTHPYVTGVGTTGTQSCGPHSWVSECPVGHPGEWNDDLKRCFDPNECAARNQEDGYTQQTTRNWQSRCVAGCTLAFDPAQGRICATHGNSITCSGVLQYTGAVCSLPPGEPGEDDHSPSDPPPQECVQASDNQSFCMKPDGKHCYTASSGRQVCWNPQETGAKADGNIQQNRNAGPEAIPPANPNLPNGDTLEQSGDPITTVTTTTGGGGSSTTTTTTTNYGTGYGTHPGTGDEGEPSDGSGGGPDGEGDSEDGSAEGGGDCDTPPIVRGDAILGMIADQAWATRCAVEAGNAAKVTGDVGDCKSPFTVEGTNANAEQLRALRAKICDGVEARENERSERQADGDALGSEADALAAEYGENIWGEGDGTGQGINPNWLSFGGGACPVLSFEIPGVGVWEPPPMFCNVIAAIALLFQLVAMVWALQIVGS